MALKVVWDLLFWLKFQTWSWEGEQVLGVKNTGNVSFVFYWAIINLFQIPFHTFLLLFTTSSVQGDYGKSISKSIATYEPLTTWNYSWLENAESISSLIFPPHWHVHICATEFWLLRHNDLAAVFISSALIQQRNWILGMFWFES